MKPCPKHPDYDGGYSGIPIDWNCRHCRRICKAVKEYEKGIVKEPGKEPYVWAREGGKVRIGFYESVRYIEL